MAVLVLHQWQEIGLQLVNDYVLLLNGAILDQSLQNSASVMSLSHRVDVMFLQKSESLRDQREFVVLIQFDACLLDKELVVDQFKSCQVHSPSFLLSLFKSFSAVGVFISQSLLRPIIPYFSSVPLIRISLVVSLPLEVSLPRVIAFTFEVAFTFEITFTFEIPFTFEISLPFHITSFSLKVSFPFKASFFAFKVLLSLEATLLIILAFESFLAHCS
jgi:hypothetical protein